MPKKSKRSTQSKLPKYHVLISVSGGVAEEAKK